VVEEGRQGAEGAAEPDARGIGGAGAQLNADGTFRVDFDLPGADNEALRALEGPLNDVIRKVLPVSAAFMPHGEAQVVPGLFRSKAVAPPAGDDGLVRIVEILDLDRQACGGAHLVSTGTRPARIAKIDKGPPEPTDQDRGLVGSPAYFASGFPAVSGASAINGRPIT
jgi:hypothetical protein